MHLSPREAARPPSRAGAPGSSLSSPGLLQVTVAGQTPAIRHGEVLVAAAERIEGWRNLGQGEATAFWIVFSLSVGRPVRNREAPLSRPH